MDPTKQEDTVLKVSLAHFTELGKPLQSFKKIAASKHTETKMLALFYTVIDMLQASFNRKVYPSYYSDFLKHGIIQNTLFIESVQIYENNENNENNENHENHENNENNENNENHKGSLYVYRILFIPNEYSDKELQSALEEKKASDTNNLIQISMDPQAHAFSIKEYTHVGPKKKKIWDFMKEIEDFPEQYRIHEFFSLLVMWMSVPRHVSKHPDMKQNFKKMVQRHKRVYDFKKFKWHTTMAMIQKRPNASKIHPIFFNELVLQRIWDMGSLP